MATSIAVKAPRRDYSLTGPEGALAAEKGLVNAQWYAPPVPKEKMRELLERRDQPMLYFTILWFFLLGLFGVAGYFLWGTLWAIVPFAIYGVLYSSASDSRWHETSHGTAFKTDWMNNAIYEIASFMVLRESVVWRWSHPRHHSDTIIVGRDREIAVEHPTNLFRVALKFVNAEVLPQYWRHVIPHCFGRVTPDERTFIPETEYGKMFVRARIYVAIYAGVIALAAATGSLLPLMYIGLPNIYGCWLMVVYAMPQHAGLAEDVLDHRYNTRTVYFNRINRYMYLNMGWHVEHHIFPLVPFHALPKLHELIKGDLAAPYNGLIEAYREIIPTLIRCSKDATYYYRRETPTPQFWPETVRPAAPAPTVEAKPAAAGLVEVCQSSELPKEDLLRFDHDDKVYAIYRTADGKLYATDGICTHGNADLCDGFLKGTIIECPKHNGRFDIRDGSPQRQPVSIPLKTYDVREADGKILLDLRSAHGVSLTEVATTYTFRVVSNDNVATFIKELVLEPDDPSQSLIYQPGEYLQFNVPAYEACPLRGVDVKVPYADVWRAQKVFDLTASNPIACRRDYSFASNPAVDKHLRFNIRLAVPPAGQTSNMGVGSAYLFGLKPGDKVTAIGPFGAFHIKSTDREMVYLGGGSGMAPLRSHIAYLFETEKTTRRVSYWYGARSLQEMFYRDYFEELARKNENFTFHVALSQPLPDDRWTSHTGFIHEVLKREYLDSHPDPTQVEYYVCGPLPMVRAAIKMLAELGVDRDQIAADEF
jgi:Na+-transporting NADH:ubiquinone oxidoreductase subunit F